MTIRKRRSKQVEAVTSDRTIVRAYAASGAQIGHVTATGRYEDTRGESTIRTALYTALLPRGYPTSVPAEYTTFQIYNILQTLCSYVREQLAAKAVLLAAGVGNAEATALSAASVFVFRDMAGHIASLLFAGVYSSSFRARIKQWRLFADLANSAALLVELCAPVLGRRAFLVCVTLASVFRAACGTIAGVVRVSFSHHFASECSDPADVAAKEGAQNTVNILVGMALGWAAAAVTDEKPVALWTLFIALTVAHIWLNVCAVQAISLKSLDTARFETLVELADQNSRFGETDFATPREVARKEALLPSFIVSERALHWCACRFGYMRISLGVDVRWVLSAGAKWDTIANMDVNKDYVIVPLVSERANRVGGTIAILLRQGTRNSTKIMAVWIAAIAANSIMNGVNAKDAIEAAETKLATNGGGEALSDALNSAGWDLSCGILGDAGFRVELEKNRSR